MAVLRWLIIAILLLGDLLSPFPMLFLHRSGAAGAMAFALLLAVSMVAFLAAAVQGLRLRYPPPHGLHFPDAGMWRIMLGGSIPVLVFSACWWILFLHAGPLVSDAGWMQGMAGWQKYFYVLLFAPITEEAAYRAWLLGPQWNGRTLPLRLFVACFGFAWGHLLFSDSGEAWFQFGRLVDYLAFSCVVTFLWLRTRNLWVCVAMHFASNLLAEVLKFVG